MSLLVLASESRWRRQVLSGAGLEFEVKPAHVDEDEIKLAMKAEGAAARDVAEALAELKGKRVSAPQDARFVIAADQMLECEGRWFDKPRSRDEARAHLQFLRGKTHRLHTAAVVTRHGAAIWRRIETPELTMRAFSDDFLEAYLAEAGDTVLGTVGAYQLESIGVQLFSRIQGDYFTILGLPLLPLLDFLRANQLVRA